MEPQEQKKTTDPQEDEKNGNVLGDAFDAVFGNVNGEGSPADGEHGHDIEKKRDIPQQNTDKPTGQ